MDILNEASDDLNNINDEFGYRNDIIALFKYVKEHRPDANIAWFIAYHQAQEFHDLSTKDIARILMDGYSPISELTDDQLIDAFLYIDNDEDMANLRSDMLGFFEITE